MVKVDLLRLIIGVLWLFAGYLWSNKNDKPFIGIWNYTIGILNLVLAFS